MALGGIVGLCHCSECGQYACRWCWEGNSGDCPNCQFVYVVPAAATQRAIPVLAVRRPGLRPSLAAAVAVVAIAVLALTLGGGFRSAGGVEGATATATNGVIKPPSAVPSTSPTPGVTPGDSQPLPVATQGIDPAASAAPTPRLDRQVGPRPTPTAKSATPTPKPTPRRTPTPTPKPTPTPTPTPQPTPTPACATVPNLVGMTVANARDAWQAAGFTTTVRGAANKVIETQSQSPGECLPPDTPITVTFV